MSRLTTLLAWLLRPALRDAIHAECGHVLRDIEWRYAQARDLLNEAAGSNTLEPRGLRKLTAEDFNVLRHQLTGYTVTNNVNATGAATPGSIRWQSLHIVYAGVDYTIADGASLLKYHSFVKPASGTTASLTSSDTKPTLGQDDLLVFVNNGGIATVAASDGSASLPAVVANGAVDTSALADGAVQGTKILDQGIGANKLGTGSINAATMFFGKVVNTGALADNAVTATQLNGGSVTATKLNVLSHTLY